VVNIRKGGTIMITTKELVEYLKIHENTIYNYIKEGLPHYRVGKEYRFEIEEVKTWLKEKTVKTEA
jgi:excisionase family DNA binding protein